VHNWEGHKSLIVECSGCRLRTLQLLTLLGGDIDAVDEVGHASPSLSSRVMRNMLEIDMLGEEEYMYELCEVVISTS